MRLLHYSEILYFFSGSQKIIFSNYLSPEALTSGVSLFFTRMTIVISVSRIPREEMQIGRMAKTELCDMY